MCQHLDLFGDMLDALVQTPPVAAEVLNDSDLRGDKDVDALGQNFWELLAQKAKPLADRNAVLQQKATDLINHSGPLADQTSSHAVKSL